MRLLLLRAHQTAVAARMAMMCVCGACSTADLVLGEFDGNGTWRMVQCATAVEKDGDSSCGDHGVGVGPAWNSGDGLGTQKQPRRQHAYWKKVRHENGQEEWRKWWQVPCRYGQECNRTNCSFQHRLMDFDWTTIAPACAITVAPTAVAAPKPLPQQPTALDRDRRRVRKLELEDANFISRLSQDQREDAIAALAALHIC